MHRFVNTFFIVLCLSPLILTCTWLTGSISAQEPASEGSSTSQKPGIAEAQGYVHAFLENMTKVESDYCCWIEGSNEILDTENHLVMLYPFERIYAENQEKEWKYWAQCIDREGRFGPNRAWYQLVESEKETLYSLGIFDPMRISNINDLKGPYGYPKHDYVPPSRWPMLIAAAVDRAEMASEHLLVNMFLNAESFYKGEVDEETGDFVALWKRGGKNPGENLVVFSKEHGFPILLKLSLTNGETKQTFQRLETVSGKDWRLIRTGGIQAVPQRTSRRHDHRNAAKTGVEVRGPKP